MSVETTSRLLDQVLGDCTFTLTVDRVRDTTLSDQADGSPRLSTNLDRKLLGQCRAAELRETYREGTWRNGEWGETLKIAPRYDGGTASRSASKIDSLLDGYLDAERAHIGHALAESINGSEFGRYEGNRLSGPEKVSSLKDFRDYLVIGAALLGSQRMAEHLSGWMAGKPLHYRTMALLVGARIKANLEIEPGVRVERLPANTKELPESVPGLGSVPPMTYLGAVVLCVDCEVAPVLYRPEKAASGGWDFCTERAAQLGTGISIHRRVLRIIVAIGQRLHPQQADVAGLRRAGGVLCTDRQDHRSTEGDPWPGGSGVPD